MRPGGGKEKGAAFERKTGVALSGWITNSTRTDLFSRNVLSGGKFTLHAKKGERQGVPGDLMASHPLAYDFLKSFLVECKHKQDLELQAYFFDTKGSTFLARTIQLCRDQAKVAKVDWLLIAKQNLKPTLLLMEQALAQRVLAFVGPTPPYLFHHTVHNVAIFPFDLFCKVVPYKLFRKCVIGHRSNTTRVALKGKQK